jgi:hypothetical protein
MERRLRAWADATTTCLALMRAGLRARHPRMSAARIEQELARTLARQKRAQDASYERRG